MKERRMVQPGCWSPSRVKEAFIRGTGDSQCRTRWHSPRHQNCIGHTYAVWGFLGPQWAKKDTFLRDERKGQGKKGDIK